MLTKREEIERIKSRMTTAEELLAEVRARTAKPDIAPAPRPFKVGDLVVTEKFRGKPGWDPFMDSLDGKIGVVVAVDLLGNRLDVKHEGERTAWFWPITACRHADAASAPPR